MSRFALVLALVHLHGAAAQCELLAGKVDVKATLDKWCYELKINDAVAGAGGCSAYYAKGLNSGMINFYSDNACLAAGTCGTNAKCEKSTAIPDFECNCLSWCNSHTCGQSECSACPVCADLENDAHCEPWCNSHTCSDGHCTGCTICGGTVPIPVPRPTPTTPTPVPRPTPNPITPTPTTPTPTTPTNCLSWCNSHVRPKRVLFVPGVCGPRQWRSLRAMV